RRAAELQHLHEQIAKGLEMAAAELGDGAEIGPVHRRHRHEIQPLFAGLRQSSRGIDAAAVAVEQQRHHQRRMKRRKAALLFVAIKDSAQIEIVAHGVANEMRDVPCRHEISQRRRQNPGLIDVPRTESLAHPPTESRFALYVEQIRPLQGRAPSSGVRPWGGVSEDQFMIKPNLLPAMALAAALGAAACAGSNDNDALSPVEQNAANATTSSTQAPAAETTTSGYTDTQLRAFL